MGDLLIYCLDVYQIGGGSLRIYKRDVQEKVLEIIGISAEEVRITFCLIFTEKPYLMLFSTNRLKQSSDIFWRLLTWVLLLMVCKFSKTLCQQLDGTFVQALLMKH